MVKARGWFGTYDFFISWLVVVEEGGGGGRGQVRQGRPFVNLPLYDVFGLLFPF